MTTCKTVFVSLFLIIAISVYTVVVYPALPEQVPCHWNLRGEVDGWMPKQLAAFFGPGLMGGMFLLLLTLPRLSQSRFRRKGLPKCKR